MDQLRGYCVDNWATQSVIVLNATPDQVKNVQIFLVARITYLPTRPYGKEEGEAGSSRAWKWL